MTPCAGTGFYFDDIPTDLIEAEDTLLSRKANFVLGVNEHSMEPTYNDGEKVLVRLISHNKDKAQYPNILIDDRRIDIVGKILGRI